MSKKKTHEEFLKELEKKFPGKFILLDEYNGRLQRIRVKCASCGREWTPRAKDLLDGYGCRVCQARMTHEQFVEKFNASNNKNIQICSQYICSSEPIHVQCLDCNYEWDTKPQNLLYNHGCPKCGNSLKKTTETFFNELDERFPGKYRLVGEYVNCNTKITVQCNICKYIWDVNPSSLLNNGGCPNCFKLHQSEIVRAAKLNSENCFANGDQKLLSEWQYCVDSPSLSPQDFACGSSLISHWKCSVCGHEWDASVNNRTNGHGCPSCTNKKKRTHDEFLSDIADMLDRIEVLEEYRASDKPIKVRCINCGHEWSPVARSLLNGCGCRVCSLANQTSSLQRLVVNYLKDKIQQEPLHEDECTLKCYNPTTGRLLPFDNEVNVDGQKLIIEVHGMQHYVATGFVKMSAEKLGVLSEELFEYNQWKDAYKKQFAIEHGYMYLEIPYWTEKNEAYKEMIDKKINEIHSMKGNDNL